MSDSDYSSVPKAEPFSARQARTALAYVRERRKHFQLTGFVLARQARNMSNSSSVATIAIIILGAFVGTKAVMDNLLGTTNTVNVLVYAFAGLLIAVLSGLEGVFKWNSKAAELRVIAAQCRQAEHAIDMELRTIPDDDLQAAMALLKRMDVALNKIEEEAFKIGVDLPAPLSSNPPSPPAKGFALQNFGKKSSALLREMEDTATHLGKV